jgi:hypothetical protein
VLCHDNLLFRSHGRKKIRAFYTEKGKKVHAVLLRWSSVIGMGMLRSAATRAVRLLCTDLS